MTKSRGNKGLIVLGVIALGALGIWLWSQGGPGRNQKTGPREIIANHPIFHPDSVRAFGWKTEKKDFSFVRESRDESWRPRARTTTIQDRLNAIAVLPLTEPKAGPYPPPDPLLRVEIRFSDDQIWKGQSDGLRFAWTEGAYRGREAMIPGSMKPLFAAGAYAFSNPSIRLCPERPTSIEVKGADPAFKIWQDGLKWRRSTTKAGKTQEDLVDPSRMERWLGENCQPKADAYIDTSVVASPLWNQTIMFVFSTRNPLELRADGEDAFQAGFAFHSTSLAKAFRLLLEWPAVSEKDDPR